MVEEALIRALNTLISEDLQSKGFELIDLIYRFTGAKLILTVLVDKPEGNGLASAGQSHKPPGNGLASVTRPYRTGRYAPLRSSQSHRPLGGITLQECTLLCRQLKNLIEEKNIINRDYVLEVSSPGLDRPLKSKKDFLRSLNKEAIFFLNDLVGGKCQCQGIISRVEETTVFIQAPGDILEIPLIKINKAQLVI